MKIGNAFALSLLVASTTLAQEQKPSPFATTQVEGTDNVYIFRYGNSQAMFVVTNDGVIATDPIGYGRPQAVNAYIDEIRKVSDKPIRYLIYSHHHFDHIGGGQPFKAAGAKIIAHRRAKERLAVLKDPFTPLPDETIGSNERLTSVVPASS
jgi:glyoxylase-like metal-dependent hydrolase (beta-lactamase superfamily II)